MTQTVLFGRFVSEKEICFSCGADMPRGLRTLHLSFSETHLTHFGGMILLQRFCSQLKLRWLLQRYVTIHQRNSDYLPSDMILMLLYTDGGPTPH